MTKMDLEALQALTMMSLEQMLTVAANQWDDISSKAAQTVAQALVLQTPNADETTIKAVLRVAARAHTLARWIENARDDPELLAGFDTSDADLDAIYRQATVENAKINTDALDDLVVLPDGTD